MGFSVFKTDGVRFPGVGVRFPLISAIPASEHEEEPVTERALMDYSHGAGCGCKLSAAELRSALASMTVPIPTSPAVQVGIATSDDAGVYRLSDELALVQTLDFFTPIVNDPATWGRIAATNALSDVYAMGGHPITALNIVAWPRDDIGWSVLGAVLDGGASVLAEAGCALVGGHSIDDAEPKYGLSVTGLVRPDEVMSNAGGSAGDVLVLTKPLGTGIATTAMKRGTCPPTLEAAAIGAMTTLNARASKISVAAGVRCATDVTGFGLMGHLSEMVAASGVGARVEISMLPAFDGVIDLIADGIVPGGTRRNVDAVVVDWGGTHEAWRVLACDAQTSGGLLLAVPPASLDSVLASGKPEGLTMSVIGELTDAPSGPAAIKAV